MFVNVGKPGEGLPVSDAESHAGRRKRQVSAFLESGAPLVELDTAGCKEVGSCFSSTKVAIRKLGVEDKCHATVKNRRLFIVAGPAPEPDGRGNKTGYHR